MKKIIFIALLALSISCKKECTEALGDIVEQEIQVANFDKIIAKTGIELIIKESNTQKVIVKTGKNKLDNVDVVVIDGTLELEANNTCLLTPDIKPVKVFVFSPNISSIRNASEYPIYSDGILTFPEIILLTEDYNTGYLNIGNFNLKVNNEKIVVTSNGISNISISGNTEVLRVSCFNGIGRFEGKNLIAENVYVYHRGENDIIVNPQESLTGRIVSVGDVLSYNHPSIVTITEEYEGEVIYK